MLRKEDLKKTGYDFFRLHDLRRTAAIYMIAKGVPVRMVLDISGYADIKTTMHYSKGLAAN